MTKNELIQKLANDFNEYFDANPVMVSALREALRITDNIGLLIENDIELSSEQSEYWNKFWHVAIRYLKVSWRYISINNQTFYSPKHGSKRFDYGMIENAYAIAMQKYFGDRIT